MTESRIDPAAIDLPPTQPIDMTEIIRQMLPPRDDRTVPSSRI